MRRDDDVNESQQTHNNRVLLEKLEADFPKHALWLRRFVARWNHYITDSEELQGRAILKFLKAIQRGEALGRGHTNKDGLLYRIVQRTAFTMLKENKRAHAVPLDDLDDSDLFGVSGSPDPLQQLLWAESDALMAAAIRELSPRRQAVIELTRDGYTVQEIMDALGLNEGTVKSSRNRARKSIKDFLASQDMGRAQ